MFRCEEHSFLWGTSFYEEYRFRDEYRFCEEHLFYEEYHFVMSILICKENPCCGYPVTKVSMYNDAAMCYLGLIDIEYEREAPIATSLNFFLPQECW